ncbi:MAG: ABC transporter permease [Lachnospiraceae bacterium]|nr:ABC transporter permease [Lachnospiraceae bacterium]
MKVANRKCIRRLSFRTMRNAKLKNFVAIAAIMLTTILFTSLFTVAMSIVYGFEQSTFRQVGGYSHAGFKYLTYEQVEELKEDPLIKEYGVRYIVGMPTKEPFHKSHVEVSYCDANVAKWMFCEPIEGRLPMEGTNEAATDLKVLELLGVTPEIGTEFTITITAGKQEVSETFTLCGWWEYDEAVTANHILVPESRAKEITSRFDAENLDSITGTYQLDVMYSNSRHIEQNNIAVLERHGYQSEDRMADNYIAYGVNWAYMSAQLDENLDPMTILSVCSMLLLIIATGYLIIYNVFQISVSNDIRFYGMLKTIGTTGRQIKRILYIQAFCLSAVGIPLGLAAGYGVGSIITSIVLKQLNSVGEDTLSTSPLIFVFSAVFALFTVIISCRRPGKCAARVSPIEALRYTEGEDIKRTVKKSGKGASIWRMAWANLGRSRSKTAVTVISLSLAVVLLNLTVTFTNGFDMEKYVSLNIATDYLVANGSHLETNGIMWNKDIAVSEDVIAQINMQEGIADSGRAYGLCSSACEFVSEDWYRKQYARWTPEDQLDILADRAVKENGFIMDRVQLYGMEDFCLDHLTVLEGDLEKLHNGGKYVAAVYMCDDYGKPEADSHWAKLGDKVTIRYIDKWEYYGLETGEIFEEAPEDETYQERPLVYHDEVYEVAALVDVPNALSYRYWGADQFVMNAANFCEATGTSSVMYYAYDMDQSNPEYFENMESFLENYTENINAEYGYESRKTTEAEFESLRNMFGIVGGALSFIVALVGILNFMNAIVTGILTRKRELAVLQAVGMTGGQLKQMLMLEGMYEALGAVAAALILTLLTVPFAKNILNGMFWFFSYRFTIIPIFLIAPVFAALGMLIPYIAYRSMVKKSVVERLREAE